MPITLKWERHPARDNQSGTSYDLVARTHLGDYEISHAQDGYYLFLDNCDLKHLKSLENIKLFGEAHFLGMQKSFSKN
ncbi:MAG: hypothetical protein Q8P15_03530 [Nanoarchaeota archaeon]|nr:hypothetical protein [Nanoarchaeota archaeon]